MSLIVDALKKAQQGAAGRLPPLVFKRPRFASPTAWARPRSPWLAIAGGAVLIGALLAVGGIHLIRRGGDQRPAAQRVQAQRVLVVEPVKSPPAAVGQEPTKPDAGTSIPEVRAALEAARLSQKEPSQKEGVALPPRTPAKAGLARDPRREVALERVKKALQEDEGLGARPPAAAVATAAVPATSAPAAPPPAPLAVPRPIDPPVPPPVVEVRPDGGKEAATLFAAALQHQQVGRLDQAIEEYEKSIVLDPRNVAAFNNLGVVLKERGQLDAAADAFQKALALDPKYEKALNNLGVVRYRKGQYEEAISLFMQAIRINPSNVESYTNLGLIYLQAGRLDEALEAFQQAVLFDPKLAEAHYNLGILWERRGNLANAQRHYEKFVDFASERHASLVLKVKERLQFLARGR